MEKQRFSDEDVPSAPPFCGSGGEIKIDRETSPVSKMEYLSSMKAEKDNLGRSPGISQQDNVPKYTRDSTVRFVFVCGIVGTDFKFCIFSHQILGSIETSYDPFFLA